MRLTPSRRASIAVAALCVLAGHAGRGAVAHADGADASDPANGVFFREPDKATRDRIDDLISQATTDSVTARRRARGELESLGYWSVEPLAGVIQATKDRDAPTRCASILTIDAIGESTGDRRAIDALRDVVVREDSSPYLAAFAALALGRWRDVAAPASFRKALAAPRVLEMLHAAVPFALARLRTQDAADVLRGQISDAGATEPVQSARLLALGFFPDAALAPGGAAPGPDLAAGLASRRRGEQQGALLGFMVATARARTGKDFFERVLAADPVPEVTALALLGLAAFDDAGVTDRLARAAAGGGPDAIREFACDLLVPRGDPAALETLLHVSRTAPSRRLVASSVLALGNIDSPEARDAVIERLQHKAPLVRAAAAVAAAGWVGLVPAASARDRAVAQIDARLGHGEADAKVRDVFQLARAVLLGERHDVKWPETGPDPLFASVRQTQRQRMLRAVNRHVERSLDLAKISNPQTDAELNPDDVPAMTMDLDTRGGLDSVPGNGDLPVPQGGGSLPTLPLGSVGSSRTSAWPELRDLKTELTRRPYFTAADLPLPPAAPTPSPSPSQK
ncbi:MAG: HEAT repeat domain-containing protein [Planctomycetes bacterium]|nr:HEAT repeat domain-containing protein [Planctomycetota bacterium]